mmetsp:Transcript_4649/g.10780  ORF Transcript_4649/g.10780 Transcript_4649/m.10780 type:complete len:229 (+) Transcript_4649:984-1670(+)
MPGMTISGSWEGDSSSAGGCCCTASGASAAASTSAGRFAKYWLVAALVPAAANWGSRSAAAPSAAGSPAACPPARLTSFVSTVRSSWTSSRGAEMSLGTASAIGASPPAFISDADPASNWPRLAAGGAPPPLLTPPSRWTGGAPSLAAVPSGGWEAAAARFLLANIPMPFFLPVATVSFAVEGSVLFSLPPPPPRSSPMAPSRLNMASPPAPTRSMINGFASSGGSPT